MPKVARYVVGCPERLIMFRVVRTMIGQGNHYCPARCKDAFYLLDALVQFFQMLQHVPKGDRVKRLAFQVPEAFFVFYLQPESGVRVLPRFFIFFDTRNDKSLFLGLV